MNISLLFSYIVIIFTVNALFFTHNLISDIYNDKISLYTFFFITSVSFLISSLLLYILREVSSFTHILELIFSDVRGKEALDIITEKASRKVKRKMKVFFIIQFILIMLTMYFLSCFCCVYHSTQKIWFFCGCISLSIGIIICLLLCAIQSLLRFAGIRCNSLCLYNIYLMFKRVF